MKSFEILAKSITKKLEKLEKARKKALPDLAYKSNGELTNKNVEALLNYFEEQGNNLTSQEINDLLERGNRVVKTGLLASGRLSDDQKLGLLLDRDAEKTVASWRGNNRDGLIRRQENKISVAARSLSPEAKKKLFLKAENSLPGKSSISGEFTPDELLELAQNPEIKKRAAEAIISRNDHDERHVSALLNSPNKEAQYAAIGSKHANIDHIDKALSLPMDEDRGYYSEDTPSRALNRLITSTSSETGMTDRLKQSWLRVLQDDKLAERAAEKIYPGHHSALADIANTMASNPTLAKALIGKVLKEHPLNHEIVNKIADMHGHLPEMARALSKHKDNLNENNINKVFDTVLANKNENAYDSRYALTTLAPKITDSARLINAAHNLPEDGYRKMDYINSLLDNPNLPKEALEALKPAANGNEHLTARIIKHPNHQTDFSSLSENEQLSLIGNNRGSDHQERMRMAAQTTYPKVKLAILKNTRVNLNENEAKLFTGDSSPAVRTAFYKKERGFLSEQQKLDAIRDKSLAVRKVVLGSMKSRGGRSPTYITLPPSVIAEAIRSKNKDTRALAAGHPNITQEGVALALKDKMPEVVNSVLDNEKAPISKEQATEAFDKGNRVAAIKRFHSVDKDAPYPDHIEQHIANESSDEVASLALAQNKHALKGETIASILNRHPALIEQALAHKNTPSEVISNVLRNENKDNDYNLRQLRYSAIRHPNLPVSTIRDLASNPNTDKRELGILANNPSLPDDAVNHLLHNAYDGINGNGEKYHSDRYAEIITALGKNRDLSKEAKEKIFEHIKNDNTIGSRYGDKDALGHLIRHSHPDLLQKMYSHSLTESGAKTFDHNSKVLLNKKVGLLFPDTTNKKAVEEADRHTEDPNLLSVIKKGSVEVHPAVEKLKHLKGIIEATPERSIHKKELEKMGHANLPSQLLNPKGLVTPESIESFIGTLPKTKYNLSIGSWNGAQRHDPNRSQMVVQVNLTDDMAKQLNDQGLFESFNDIYDMSNRSGHPTRPHSLGWARIDASQPGHWHIDEIQSDFGQGTIGKIRDWQQRGQISSENAEKYIDHIKKIGKICSPGHKTINRAIFSTVHQLAREAGIKSTSMDLVKDQSVQSNMDQGKDYPVHMKDTYEELPPSVGYTEGNKKDVMPEHKSQWNGAQTRKLVKSLEALKKQVNDLKYFYLLKKSEDLSKAKPKTASSDGALPDPKNSQKTQIAGTLPTYAKAHEMLKQHGGEGGKALDFGAGLGLGAKHMGADSYEPFPRAGFKPTYTDPSAVPDDHYHKVTNLNVLNVVPKNIRDSIVGHIGRVLKPGGTAIITTRGRDVLSAKGTPGPEPMSIITSANTYQKGFTPQELHEYVRDTLGEGFEVSRIKLGPAGVMIKKKR
jgi:hypothetical protein